MNIPKEWLTFYRCTECHAVYALTLSDEREQTKLYGGPRCLRHDFWRPLQEIENI